MRLIKIFPDCLNCGELTYISKIRQLRHANNELFYLKRVWYVV